MKITKFIGRILLAILFVNAGIAQLQTPDQFINYVNVRYPVFHSYVNKHTGNALEGIQQLNPNEFIKHTGCLIKTIGWTQIVLGFGAGIGIQGAGCLLALFTMIVTAFSHNPLVYEKQVNQQQEILQIVYNLGIVGALFLVGSNKKKKAVGCAGFCTKPKNVVPEVAPKKEQPKEGKAKGKKK